MSFFYFVTVTQESQMVFSVMLTGLVVLVHSHLYAWTLVNWTIFIFWMNGCAFWWVLEAQKVSAYPDFTQSLRIKWIPLRIVTKINKKQRDFEFDNDTKCCLWGTPVQLVAHFSCTMSEIIGHLQIIPGLFMPHFSLSLILVADIWTFLPLEGDTGPVQLVPHFGCRYLK